MQNDVDELEALLGKAQRQIARRSWLKTALVCASTFGGAAVALSRGAVELTTLVRNLATKDDVAVLIGGQQKQLDSLRTDHTALANRVTSNEAIAMGASACCSKESKRVDALYAMPMRVTNR